MYDKLLTGLGGFTASVISTPMLIDAPEEGILNAIVQIVIAIVTIFGVLRKRRK